MTRMCKELLSATVVSTEQRTVTLCCLSSCSNCGCITATHAGGYEYDGRTEIAEVDAVEVREAARKVAEAGLRCVVVSGVFSVVNPGQEARVVALLEQALHELAPQRRE
jgi:hypothetical protein